MSYKIARLGTQVTVRIVANTCESEVFDMVPFTMGCLRMPPAWTAATIGFKVSPVTNTLHLPVKDDAGALVVCVSTGPDAVHVLPAELGGVRWVRLWSTDGAGADVDQTAERAITVSLKG